MKRIATLRILLSLCFGLAACGIYVPRIITNVPITPKRKWLSPGARASLATICVLLLSVPLVGCATGMRMSAADIQTLGPDDGVIVGSLLVKGGKDLLGRRRWELVTERFLGGPFTSGPQYSIEADRDGGEVIFLTKMPAGTYHFYKLVQPGFSSFEAETDVRFRVQPGRTVYVGRVVVEFPPGMLTTFKSFRISVEDAGAASISRAESEYGVSLSNVITDLMIVR